MFWWLSIHLLEGMASKCVFSRLLKLMSCMHLMKGLQCFCVFGCIDYIEQWAEIISKASYHRLLDWFNMLYSDWICIFATQFAMCSKCQMAHSNFWCFQKRCYPTMLCRKKNCLQHFCRNSGNLSRNAQSHRM